MARTRGRGRGSTGKGKSQFDSGGAAGGGGGGEGAVPTDYEHDFDDLNAEAAGEDFVGEAEARPAMASLDSDEDEDEDPQEEAAPDPFMFFDFRRGQDRWPQKVELLSPAVAAAAIATEREALEQGNSTTAPIGPALPKGGDTKYSSGGFGSDDLWGKGNVLKGSSSDDDSDDSDGEPLKPVWEGGEAPAAEGPPVLDEVADAAARAAAATKAAAAAEAKLNSPAPPGARFVTLSDGSTAALVPAGCEIAPDETVILLHPPLPLVGVSIGMERGCQQNDSLVRGYCESAAHGIIHGIPLEFSSHNCLAKQTHRFVGFRAAEARPDRALGRRRCDPGRPRQEGRPVCQGRGKAAESQGGRRSQRVERRWLGRGRWWVGLPGLRGWRQRR